MLFIYLLVCDASLHPSDPFSDVRSDQTLQDLAYMIVPKLFQRECERRKEFCKKNKIEYRMPKFKTKQGYIPGNKFVSLDRVTGSPGPWTGPVEVLRPSFKFGLQNLMFYLINL